MNTKKMLLFLIIVSMVSIGMVSAQTQYTISLFQSGGNMTVQVFQEAAGNLAILKNALQSSIPEDVVLKQYIQITKPNSEASKMMKWVTQNKLPADSKTGDVYGVSVERGQYDGWMVFFRRNASGKWDFYLYYYEIEIL